MKVKIPCFKCFEQDGIKEPVFSFLELGESNIHEVICTRGHKTFIALTQHKHEILFEIGAMALADGYPREAIATIAAALERFYELCIRVISSGIEIPEEQLHAAWRLIDAASERQFGAFILSMLLWSKECPEVIDNKKPTLPNTSRGDTKTWKEFRNAVIHKGLIPSECVTIEYCELVYAHMNELTKTMTLRHEEAWLSEAQKQATVARQANPEKEIVMFGLPTTLFLARGTQAPGSFKEALKQLNGYREIYGR
ncbi:hypothetical protein NVV94_18195 [Pseudomonas sp. LS1212]|uniref:hypothetical protein n=1 Tax=Pseudomonas sp. LS1212 TaxID=2972478 RepID=UPI00215C0488|nr:hypothetical protein [Pseudomonas sp. LS1212]UVJ42543.1 hypothetical protein NVV94_18195 [Pseudomonas sp. LS1212]